MSDHQALSTHNELKRKAIHMGTALIPLFYNFIWDYKTTLYICLTLLFFLVVGDLLRANVNKLQQLYENYFGKLTRESEKRDHFNGATFLFIGFSASIILFEQHIAIMAMLLLALADSFAAIIGKTYGTHGKFGKTYTGSLAFFAIAMLITNLFYADFKVNLLISILVTIIEFLPIRINDNLLIPISSGLFYTWLI